MVPFSFLKNWILNKMKKSKTNIIYVVNAQYNLYDPYAYYGRIVDHETEAKRCFVSKKAAEKYIKKLEAADRLKPYCKIQKVKLYLE